MIKRTVSQEVFTSKQALKVARAGHIQACKELDAVPVHLLDVGNPNHPIHDGLFGYGTKIFLSKQF